MCAFFVAGDLTASCIFGNSKWLLLTLSFHGLGNCSSVCQHGSKEEQKRLGTLLNLRTKYHYLSSPKRHLNSLLNLKINRPQRRQALCRRCRSRCKTRQPRAMSLRTSVRSCHSQIWPKRRLTRTSWTSHRQQLFSVPIICRRQNSILPVVPIIYRPSLG